MTTLKPVRLRKKYDPLAIQYDGTNEAEVDTFTRATNALGAFRHRPEHNGIQVAEVYDYLHDTWVGVKVTDWIMRGAKDEHYPCDDATLRENYDIIADPPTAAVAHVVVASYAGRGDPEVVIATQARQRPAEVIERYPIDIEDNGHLDDALIKYGWRPVGEWERVEPGYWTVTVEKEGS